jgi:hypothetical protein
MHDLNGKRIEVGDVVKVGESDLRLPKRVGTVVQIFPAAESCNYRAVVPVPGGIEHVTATANRAEIVLKANGYDPT